jgi:hypothetical protein
MSSVIAGRVLDATGSPLVGATVALGSSSVPVSDIAARTGADGQFRRGGLDPGTYTVEVSHPDYPLHREPVEVADGQVLTLEIRLGDEDVNNPVNPASNGDVISVEVEPHLINWDQVRQVRVGLNYPGSGRGDATRRDCILTAANHDVSSWQVPLSDMSRNTYSYEIEYFMADGSRRRVRSDGAREQTLVLDPSQ